MQSHSALPYFHIFILIGNGSLFFKFTVYIVKIDKKRNPLKSIAENDSSLPQCIWIVCTTPELVCGGGEQGIGTPCMVCRLRFCSIVLRFLKVLRSVGGQGALVCA